MGQSDLIQHLNFSVKSLFFLKTITGLSSFNSLDHLKSKSYARPSRYKIQCNYCIWRIALQNRIII